MLKIMFNQSYEGVTTDATFTIDEEANTAQAIDGFVKVLLLAGYADEAIRHALEEAECDMYESIESAKKVMDGRREIS